MSGTRCRLPLVAVAISFAAGVIGCQPITRYAVTVSAVESCLIRENGEFCDVEERLPPPSDEIWSVIIEEEHTVLYIGSETWLAAGIEGPREARKQADITRNACTTSNTRVLIFNEDAETFSGTLEQRVRVTGPEACGQTPFGDRQLFNVAGEVGPLL